MWPYFVILGALALLSISEALSQTEGRSSQQFGMMAATVLMIFAVLRFETGFDWVAYEANYAATPAFTAMLNGQSPFYAFLDPGFAAVNVALKTIRLPPSGLFVVTSAVSVIVIHAVMSKITSRMALFWLMYFGLLFISAQMTLVRQNLASCAVLAALYFVTTKRNLPALIAMAVAISFHLSVLIFAPLLLLARHRLPIWLVASTVAGGVIVAVIGVDLASSVQGALARNAISPGLAARIEYYANAAVGVRLTANGLMLLIAHCAMLMWLLVAHRNETEDPFIKTAAWLLLIQISLQLWLPGATDLWARTMLVVTPWAFAAILRTQRSKEMGRLAKVGVALVVCLGGAIILYRPLAQPYPNPLVPYHTIIQAAFGDVGDGRERAIAAWKMHYPVQEDIDNALSEYRRLGVYPKL